MIDKILSYNIVSTNGTDTELTKITGFTVNQNTSYNAIQDASSELMTLSTNIFSDTILTSEFNVSSKLSVGYIFNETSLDMTLERPGNAGVTRLETRLTLIPSYSELVQIIGVMFRSDSGVYAATTGYIANNGLYIDVFRTSVGTTTHNTELLIVVKDKTTNNITVNQIPTRLNLV